MKNMTDIKDGIGSESWAGTGIGFQFQQFLHNEQQVPMIFIT
jgi:hypothetical protein